MKPTKTWLSSQVTYTLHKPVRKIFVWQKTFAEGIGDLYQADLVDMARYGDGVRRYILTVRVGHPHIFTVYVKVGLSCSPFLLHSAPPPSSLSIPSSSPNLILTLR